MTKLNTGLKWLRLENSKWHLSDRQSASGWEKSHHLIPEQRVFVRVRNTLVKLIKSKIWPTYSNIFYFGLGGKNCGAVFTVRNWSKGVES
jgi:hypothetical protein